MEKVIKKIVEKPMEHWFQRIGHQYDGYSEVPNAFTASLMGIVAALGALGKVDDLLPAKTEEAAAERKRAEDAHNPEASDFGPYGVMVNEGYVTVYDEESDTEDEARIGGTLKVVDLGDATGWLSVGYDDDPFEGYNVHTIDIFRISMAPYDLFRLSERAARGELFDFQRVEGDLLEAEAGRFDDDYNDPERIVVVDPEKTFCISKSSDGHKKVFFKDLEGLYRAIAFCG